MPEDYDLNWFRSSVKATLDMVDRDLGTDRKIAWVLGNAHDYKVIHQWCAVERLNLNLAERKPFRDIKSAMNWLGIPDEYEIKYPPDD